MVQLQSYIQALRSGHSQALTPAGSPATLPGNLGCRQGGTAPCVLPASHRPTGAARPPGSLLPLLLQHREVTHVLGNGNPTAPSRQRSCRAPPGLCPQQPGERASALAPRRGLHNPSNIPAFLRNSRPFAVLLLIPICTQLFPGWQHRQRARPVLCQHSAYERSETTGAFVLTAGFALPTALSVIFQGHQSKEPSGKSLKGPWHQMAAVGPSDLQAFQELPPAPHAARGPQQEQVCFLQRSKSWEQLAATHTGGRKL